jgi:hypothetical protein
MKYDKIDDHDGDKASSRNKDAGIRHDIEVQKMESRCNVAGIKTNLFRSPAAATAM